MQFSNALDIINNIKLNGVETLADLFPLSLTEEAYTQYPKSQWFARLS